MSLYRAKSIYTFSPAIPDIRYTNSCADDLTKSFPSNEDCTRFHQDAKGVQEYRPGWVTPLLTS